MTQTRSRQAAAWIEIRQEPGTLVLRVCGELDLASRDSIGPAIMAAIPTAYTVLLDLADLTFCDSTGISIFVTANEKAQAEGTVLRFGNLNANVARLFHLSGLDTVLAIAE